MDNYSPRHQKQVQPIMVLADDIAFPNVALNNLRFMLMNLDDNNKYDLLKWLNNDLDKALKLKKLVVNEDVRITFNDLRGCPLLKYMNLEIIKKIAV